MGVPPGEEVYSDETGLACSGFYELLSGSVSVAGLTGAGAGDG
jgi:hypothetical protein